MCLFTNIDAPCPHPPCQLVNSIRMDFLHRQTQDPHLSLYFLEEAETTIWSGISD